MEVSMSPPKNDIVDCIDKTNFVWGTKLMGNNYKSVTIHGESFALGDCVRCSLKLRDGHVGKIVNLSQKEDKKWCRIRSFFSSSEIPPSIPGLNCTPDPKELFLASGEGLSVENDILLDMITGKCIVLCTAEEHFNEMPSIKQIESADFFFGRGYDPISKEVLGLDTVEEAIGAQKIYNKKNWLIDKINEQPPLQGTIKGIHSPICDVPLLLPRDSIERKLKRKKNNLVLESNKIDAHEKKNESHIDKKVKKKESDVPIGKSNVHYKRIVFGIQAPSKINSTRGLEVSSLKITRPISSKPKAKLIQPEGRNGYFKASSSSFFRDFSKQATTMDDREDIENTERKNEDMLGDRTPNKIIKPIQRSTSLVEKKERSELQKRVDEGDIISTSHSSKTIFNGSILHKRKALPTRNDLNSMSLKPSIMEKGLSIQCTSLCTSKEVLKTKNNEILIKINEDVSHATSANQSQFDSQILDMSSKKERKSIAKDLCCHELYSHEIPKITLSKDMTKTSIDHVANLLESPPSTCIEQKPQGQIFKPKVEDWNISLIPAIQGNRVLLLKNLVPVLHSDELAEIFSRILKIRCEVRIIPPISPNYQTTTALLKLPSAKKAQDVIHEMESKYVLVENRLVTAAHFNFLEFKAPQSIKYHGHLEFPKEGRDHISDDFRNVVATSHFAQGNTIEFAFGLPWRVLDEQHEEQWQMLQEAHYSNSNKKVKRN